MHIQIRHDPQQGDMVRLAGPGQAEIRFEAWLNLTECAVANLNLLFGASTAPLSSKEIAVLCDAKVWIMACGVQTIADYEHLKRTLPLLRQPPDPSHAIRCRRCGSLIWSREALVTGLGSRCRQGMRVRHVAFERLIDRERTAQVLAA